MDFRDIAAFKMNYKNNENRKEIFRFIKDTLKADAYGIKRLKELAGEVCELTESVDPFIQQHTEAVCPDCRKVCCVNRHSYHEHEDLVYVYALGEKLPSYNEDVGDTEPCQFLGGQGCAIRRTARPYRCNWYFCASLLEHVQGCAAADYRKFTESIQQLTVKRASLLNEFLRIAEKRMGSLTPQAGFERKL